MASSLYQIKDLCRALTAAGLTYPTANARLASYARLGLIQVRARGEATRPNRFWESDILVAAVLSKLQDIGIADHGVLARVSGALYSQQLEDAVAGILQGDTWVFYLDVWRSESGRRVFECRGYAGIREGVPHDEPTTVSVSLGDNFARVIRNLRDPDGRV